MDATGAATGVATGLGVHLEKDKIGEAALAKAPSSAEAGDSTADDDDGNFFDTLRRGKRGAIAQEMTHLEGIVDEGAFDLSFTFEGEADECCATDAEKLAAYDSFVANSGTYEVAGSTITIHPVVARSPNYMSGGSDKYQFRVSGDTLWLENTGTDFRTMIGGQLVNPAARPSTTTQVLVRKM